MKIKNQKTNKQTNKQTNKKQCVQELYYCLKKVPWDRNVAKYFDAFKD